MTMPLSEDELKELLELMTACIGIGIVGVGAKTPEVTLSFADYRAAGLLFDRLHRLLRRSSWSEGEPE